MHIDIYTLFYNEHNHYPSEYFQEFSSHIIKQNLSEKMSLISAISKQNSSLSRKKPVLIKKACK